MLSIFRFLILTCVLCGLMSPVFANVRTNDLFLALQQKDWQRAHKIAQTLDAAHGKGEWLSAGMTPSQIADHLKISASTIDKYVVSAKKKLNARTRDHAVA